MKDIMNRFFLVQLHGTDSYRLMCVDSLSIVSYKGSNTYSFEKIVKGYSVYFGLNLSKETINITYPITEPFVTPINSRHKYWDPKVKGYEINPLWGQALLDTAMNTEVYDYGKAFEDILELIKEKQL